MHSRSHLENASLGASFLCMPLKMERAVRQRSPAPASRPARRRYAPGSSRRFAPLGRQRRSDRSTAQARECRQWASAPPSSSALPPPRRCEMFDHRATCGRTHLRPAGASRFPRAPCAFCRRERCHAGLTALPSPFSPLLCQSIFDQAIDFRCAAVGDACSAGGEG